MAGGGPIVGLLRFIWRVLDGLRKVMHLIVLVVLFVFVFAGLRPAIPFVPGKAALRIDIEGRIVEQLSGDPLDRALGRVTSGNEPETRLRDVLEALDTAGKDDRIEAVVLDLDDMSGSGLSKLQDIGAALRKFRATGKKVIARGLTYDQAQYYLAAQANEVYLDPFGYVFIDGFDYFRPYFKDTVDKLGVDINVFKVGTYKSYNDSYTRNSMSPEEREESLAWLNALWTSYQADVSAARKLQAGALAAYANQAAPLIKGAKGDTAKVALAQGLVTALKTNLEVEAELKGLVGEDDSTHSYNSISMDDYLAAMRSEEAFKPGGGNKIGVVVASGEILDGSYPPGTVGGDSTSEIIRDARYDDDIKALVLRVDSPGGSIFAAEQIYRELNAVRAAGKPVVVSMASVAASGGYYIAAAGDEIYASPTTITGSIGVFAMIPTFQRTLEKLGVHVDGVGTTALSGDFRLDRTLGPQSRDILQAGVENAYQEFLARVAKNRKKTPAEIDAVAQGRVWAGSDALSKGLVDSMGSLDAAVEAAARRADLGKDYTVKYLDPQITWQEALAMEFRSRFARAAGRLGFESPVEKLTRRVLSPVERELERWARFNDPRNLYSYCPCVP